mgnify:FL=1
MRTISSIIAIMALSQIGMAQETKTEVKYQTVIAYQYAIDPEAVILIEDIIEWTEWDIQEGKVNQNTGELLIQNLERLKAKLK